MVSATLTLGPVARSRSGVIGLKGGLPWRLQIFKEVTMFKPVIMGRKTWESLPRRPLPGRTNLVLSRDQSFEPKGAVVCETFIEAHQIAKEQAEEDGAEEICVIGGADLFALALPKARRIYLTEVDAEVEGDVFMPTIDESGWREVRRQSFPAGPEDEFAFTFRVLERL